MKLNIASKQYSAEEIIAAQPAGDSLLRRKQNKIMSLPELKEQVRRLLLANLVEGHSKYLKTDYCYIQPSPRTYPFQWFWDTFFHVFILCCLQEYELAKRNLLSLFAMQEENGFVGHMIYWQRLLPKNIFNVIEAHPTLLQLRPHMSALIQPTLAAQAVERIYQDTQDKNFLRVIVPKLKKYFTWLEQNRDFEKEGLITIIASVESGFDFKPSYDQVLGFRRGKADGRLYFKLVWLETKNFLRRYHLQAIYKAEDFIVQDSAFNTLYALDLQALGRLCQAVGDPQAEHWAQQSARCGRRILKIMYDEKEEAFFDVCGRSQRRLKVLTPTIFYPTALDEIPQDLACRVIRRHLLNSKDFLTPYPIPSVSRSDPAFEPYEKTFWKQGFLWRGPTWIMHNWFLLRCLRKRKLFSEAQTLVALTQELIERHGFREYYHPFTGKGFGAENFTWSGLLLDMLHLNRQT